MISFIHRDRRIGRFSIDCNLLNDHMKAVVKHIMSQVLILEARPRYDLNAIEYTGVCDGFAELEIGQVAPTYQASMRMITNEAGEHTVVFHQWVRMGVVL